jgi:hypothetical protein
VSTQGFGSNAVLAYPDGSTITLMGDSTIRVDNDRRLRLHQGIVNADIRPSTDGVDKLTLTTTLVKLEGISGVFLTLGQGMRATEVEVQHGSVAVSASTGEPLAVVREGELLTVNESGHQQQPTPTTPTEFRWDLAQPLPDGWQVGYRDETAAGPVVRPTYWSDPYYGGSMLSQIRSDHRWTRGHFQLLADSVIHVRYRADKPMDRGQVCFCVRSTKTSSSDTGMLEYNGGFKATAPGQWEELDVRAADMLPNDHTPKFGPPWIGFMVIFNTFEEDIGLQIAEFRVTPPGQPPT